jgi:rod shape determining protein RodA
MTRVDYRFQDKFDIPSFLIVTMLTIVGFLAIYSSTRNTTFEQGNFVKQIISWGISMAMFVAICYLPVRFIRIASIPAYIGSLGLLILVLLIGRVVGGQKCWIFLGSFSFQPSEVAKLGTVLFLARFLSDSKTDLDKLKDISLAVGIGLLPVGLIMLEPDLGSSLIFFGIILAMIFWRGISLFGLFFVLSPVVCALASLFGTVYFIIALVLVIAILFFFKKDIFLSGSILAVNLASGFFVDYVFNILSSHQQKRILSFVDPGADPLGAGYNSLQAKIAIGSGGLFGKGFLAGNQTQLHFIPEQWTDFIFCVIGEEFGFIGSILVIILFAVLFTRLLKIASSAKDDYLSLVVIGIMTIYLMHFMINVGMAIGVMPVIGVPLPFISYGGSSLLNNMVMFGLVINIYRSRKDFT